MAMKLVRGISLLLLLTLLPFRANAETPLTNQDVVKMVSAGLGEGLVIAKIREALQVNFKLETDDLVSLRQAGVSERIVQAMLDRNNPLQTGSRNPASEQLGINHVTVALRTTEGTIPLQRAIGDVSSPGFGPYRNVFLNFPDLKAKVRTHDRRPLLLVKSPIDLRGNRFFLTKLDVDTRNVVRSLKISSARSMLKWSFKGNANELAAPDEDWTVPFDAVEESPGIWRVTPKGALEPGEYGWYGNVGTGTEGVGFFDFGVD
jgi:hypothetical protein